MNALTRTLLLAAGLALAAQASAQVVFYENDGFDGRSFATERPVQNFQRFGFNDRASSVVVVRDRWEACSDVNYGGRCVILRPGRYPSLNAMGLNDRVSSVRTVGRNARIDDDRYAPPPPLPVYDNHRRASERLYEADVVAVHAVVGPPQQRCWMEREQVAEQHRNNVPGAIVGALIGGVLGHQVGGGRGRDVATAGGALAGAAVGANVNGRGEQSVGQDVQKCETVANSGPPEYWDITYLFRGVEHRMQVTSPPGRTVRVNAAGEPRA